MREYSKPIDLEDRVKVDLVIVGSVAVSKSGKNKDSVLISKNKEEVEASNHLRGQISLSR